MFSCGMIGALISDKLKNHCSHLKKIIIMLNEAEIMIKFKACTFSELIAHFKCCDELKNIDFINISADDSAINIKEVVLKKVYDTGLELTNEEKNNVKDFFYELGSTDLNGQIAIIEHFKEYFNNRLKNVTDENSSKCRLYKSLGVLGGAFLAVILV